MLYVTYGEQPSGVYAGQVVSVCKYLNQSFDEHIRLVAFFSIRQFSKNRAIIKRELNDAIVLPMVPKLSNWRLNAGLLFLVFLFTRERNALARNVLATNLVLMIKASGIVRKVGYDGRGAMAAEWNEYKVVKDQALRSQIADLEKKAVLMSDFRIAVSTRLVDYWRNEFGYNSDEHIVVPCTLSDHFFPELISEKEVLDVRTALNWTSDDIGLIYAGSTAGWQSFELLSSFLKKELSANPKIKVLFLSKLDENNRVLQEQFPEQVQIKWLKPSEVQRYMSACDYGLLLRDKSMTNFVAAPTKFAEYLVCGLSVIISDEIGDYSDFVREHGCGVVIDDKKADKTWHLLTKREREKNNQLARHHFTKSSEEVMTAYKRLMSAF